MKATIRRAIPKTVRDVDVMKMLLAAVSVLPDATRRAQERGIKITLVVEPLALDAIFEEEE